MNLTWKGSPNFDNNRAPITHVVIHWFGTGTLASANTRFQDPASDVSAHYGISGSTVYQWVKEEHVAYHAGNYEMNRRSIGIEHDATTTQNASDETYRSSAELVADICQRYSIPLDRSHIIGHKEVKATQCPGTIDIDRIIREAKALLNPPPTPPIITDQTKIDFGPPWGVMEVQAARGVLGDLKKDLANCQNKPPVVIEKEVIKEVTKVIHPTYTSALAQFCFNLAETLEGRGGDMK